MTKKRTRKKMEAKESWRRRLMDQEKNWRYEQTVKTMNTKRGRRVAKKKGSRKCIKRWNMMTEMDVNRDWR